VVGKNRRDLNYMIYIVFSGFGESPIKLRDGRDSTCSSCDLQYLILC
jgi:hypothetical protein